MKKVILYAVIGLLAVAAVVGGAGYVGRERLQEDIAGKVLRFHVLANSDSEEDQQLKLAVRDAVGAFLRGRLAEAESLAECEEIVGENLNEIVTVARDTVAEAGYDYGVTAALEETDFPVKSYGIYTFPAGTYEALRIVIGSGEGQNWWCVMYPNLCFSGSVYETVDAEGEEKLKEVLSPDEYERILSEGDYKIRFKYFSFLNSCLERLSE